MTYRYSLLSLVLLSLPVGSLAQLAELDWVRSAGGAGYDVSWKVAPDGAGGLYVTGQFAGEADFDGDGLADVVSVGPGDVFVARYDAAGDLVWVRRAGGSGFDTGWAIASDSTGGAYVTGDFDGRADFDGDGLADVVSVGPGDVFVARYDAAGDLVWVRRAGGAEVEQARGIASDGTGVYVTGDFEASADFDDDGMPDVTVAADAFSDLFVVRYDTAGDLAWVRSAGEPPGYPFLNYDLGWGLAPDGEGGVYVTGQFGGVVDFDADGVPEIVNSGGGDLFVARYDAAGSFLWARSAQGRGPDFGFGIAADDAGGVYVTGEFLGDVDFDGDGTADVASAGLWDLFVARYDAAGSLVWVKSAGGGGSDTGYGAAADGAGGVYVTGDFKGAVDFDGDGTADATSAGGYDLFVARYDAAGDLAWVKSAGSVEGGDSDASRGVTTDGAGGVYIAGWLGGDADFDGDGAADVQNAGDYDAFVAKYRDPAGPPTQLDPLQVPAPVALMQASPNPFRSRTTLRFSTAETAPVRLALYDLMGREVRLLYEGSLPAGQVRSVQVPAQNLPAGVYFARLAGSGSSVVQRLVVVR